MHHSDIAFASQNLDRAAHLRKPDKVAEMVTDPAARMVPLWKGKPLLEHVAEREARVGWVAMDHAILADAVAAPIFLGLAEDGPRFAVDVSGWDDPNADKDALRAFVDRTENHHPSMPDTHRFTALRRSLGFLPEEDSSNLASARSILEWHRTHQFCSRCGERSEPDDAGWRRTCPSCGAQHFPRVDPVVIMLITHGDKVLLGRSPGWPDAMYSLLAGFIEPGETIEAAVRREVFEESAVEVGEVGMIASQPWPFPSSLMIGCWGRAESTDITVDAVELEDAIWVSRERAAMAMAGHDPELSPARPGAIARALIDRWVRDTL